MPAQTPTGGNVQGEQTTPSSSSSQPSNKNFIPILNSRSRSFFLFLVVGAAIIGIVAVFFLLGDQVKVTFPEKGPDTNTVALVKGEKLTKAEYDMVYDPLYKFYTETYPEKIGKSVSQEFLSTLPKVTLDNLIMDKLLSKFLKEKGIEISDNDVRAYVEENIVKANFDGDWAKYEEYLAENNSSLETVLRNSRIDLLKETVMKEGGVSSDDFGDWYLDLRNQSDVTIYLKAYGETSQPSQ